MGVVALSAQYVCVCDDDDDGDDDDDDDDGDDNDGGGGNDDAHNDVGDDKMYCFCAIRHLLCLSRDQMMA